MSNILEPPSPQTSPHKLDDLVDTFIKIRYKKSKLKADYDAEVAKYDAVQDKIEAILLAKFGELGIESIKTGHGTAYVSVRTSASLADWDTFKEFCDRQDDPYTFIERRVSKEAVLQYKAAHDDLPPGVNWSETRVINFRKS